MRKFDTKVQYLKYKVLREVARLAWNDTLLENLFEIPKTIVPGNTPTMNVLWISSPCPDTLARMYSCRKLLS